MVSKGIVILEQHAEGGDFYRRVAGSRKLVLPVGRQIDGFLAEFKTAHQRSVRIATEKPLNPSARHKDEWVKELASVILRELPLPALVNRDRSATPRKARSWQPQELLRAVTTYLSWRSETADASRIASDVKRLTQDLAAESRELEHLLSSISATLLLEGRAPANAIAPAADLSAALAAQIEQALSIAESRPAEPSIQFEAQVRRELFDSDLPRPKGNAQPATIRGEVDRVVRDAAVKAWVLKESKGRCENCGQQAPFRMSDGVLYLEVHHVLSLKEHGSDKVDNAVALCPNCHREIHYGERSRELSEHLYLSVGRLKRP